MQQKSEKFLEFSERTENLARRLTLKLSDLPQKIGVSPAMFYAYRTGKNKISAKAWAKLEQAENLAGVAHGSRDSALIESNVSKAFRLKPGRKVPVYSWAQAGISEFVPDGVEEDDFVETNLKDERAFAIRIKGDSMEPLIREGDIVIVQPSLQARSGNCVIARLKKEGVVCKLFHLKGSDGTIFQLTSYNPVYPPMERCEEDFDWIYPIGQQTRFF